MPWVEDSDEVHVKVEVLGNPVINSFKTKNSRHVGQGSIFYGWTKETHISCNYKDFVDKNRP